MTRALVVVGDIELFMFVFMHEALQRDVGSSPNFLGRSK
jgi:hypothetical protein